MSSKISGKNYLTIIKHHINKKNVKMATKALEELLVNGNSEFAKIEAAKLILGIANSQALKEEPDKTENEIKITFDFVNPQTMKTDK